MMYLKHYATMHTVHRIKLWKFEITQMKNLYGLVSGTVPQELGMRPHHLAKKIRQNWLDLGKFGWIWVKCGQN